MKIEQELRGFVHAVADASPEAPLVNPEPNHRRTRPVAALAGGFAAALLIVGIGAWSTLAGFGGSTANDATEESGAFAGSTAEPLAFDTSALGTELAALDISATVLDAGALVANVRADIGPGYSLSDGPTFVGRVGDTDGFVAVFDHPTEPDLACGVLSENGRSEGNAMGCGPQDESNMLWVGKESVDEALALVYSWRADAAVVAVEIDTGERFWQELTSSGALLAFPASLDLEYATLTLLSKDGLVLGVQSGPPRPAEAIDPATDTTSDAPGADASEIAFDVTLMPNGFAGSALDVAGDTPPIPGGSTDLLQKWAFTRGADPDDPSWGSIEVRVYTGEFVAEDWLAAYRDTSDEETNERTYRYEATSVAGTSNALIEVPIGDESAGIVMRIGLAEHHIMLTTSGRVSEEDLRTVADGIRISD